MAVGVLVTNIQNADVGVRGQSILEFTSALSTTIFWSLVALWAVILIFYLLGLIGGRRRKGAANSATLPGRGNFLLALIVLAFWIALLKLNEGSLNFFDGGGGGGGGGDGGVAPDPVGGGTVGGGFVLVLFFIVIVASVLISLRQLKVLPRLAREAPRSIDAGAEIGVVETAIEDIQGGEDFRSVVIRMYRHMCRLISDAKTRGTEFMTPRELARMAVEELKWPESPVAELTSLFEEARYSHHEIDAFMQRRAVFSLESIRDDIAARRDLTRGEALGRPVGS